MRRKKARIRDRFTLTHNDVKIRRHCQCWKVDAEENEKHIRIRERTEKQTSAIIGERTFISPTHEWCKSD